MPVARREAEVLWEGPLASGTGTLKSGSSALDEVDGAPRITSAELSVRARVPGLDAGKFEQIVGTGGRPLPGLQRVAWQRGDQHSTRAAGRPERRRTLRCSVTPHPLKAVGC